VKYVIGAAIILLALLIMGGLFEQISRSNGNSRFTAPGEMVGTRVGERHVQCSANSTGQLVVFLSGAGGTALDWQPVLASLGEGVRACVYDRAGLGWSPSTEGERDLRALAEEALAVIDTEDTKGSAILVGHSFGGYLAQYIARAHSDRVSGLILIDSLEAEFHESVAHGVDA